MADSKLFDELREKHVTVTWRPEDRFRGPEYDRFAPEFLQELKRIPPRPKKTDSIRPKVAITAAEANEFLRSLPEYGSGEVDEDVPDEGESSGVVSDE